MSTPSQALEIKLKQEVSVNNPHFFEVEYAGKISYILGTFHVISYSALHKDVKAIIRKANSLVLERETDDRRQLSRNDITFGLHGPFRSPNEIDYYSFLPSFVQKLLDDLVNKISNFYLEGNGFKDHE